jgi:hypothetical protein
MYTYVSFLDLDPKKFELGQHLCAYIYFFTIFKTITPLNKQKPRTYISHVEKLYCFPSYFKQIHHKCKMCKMHRMILYPPLGKGENQLSWVR